MTRAFHWLSLSPPPIVKHLGVAQSLTCPEWVLYQGNGLNVRTVPWALLICRTRLGIQNSLNSLEEESKESEAVTRPQAESKDWGLVKPPTWNLVSTARKFLFGIPRLASFKENSERGWEEGEVIGHFLQFIGKNHFLKRYEGEKYTFLPLISNFPKDSALVPLWLCQIKRKHFPNS